MKNQIATALLVAAMALGTASSPALAAEAAPANTISVLHTALDATPIVGSDWDSPLNGPGMLQISFENVGNQAATAVEFEVDAAGLPATTIDDVGTFTKDAIVKHEFVYTGDPNSTVSVVGVKYADGSEWSANGQQPFVSRRQAAAEIVPAGPYIPSYN